MNVQKLKLILLYLEQCFVLKVALTLILGTLCKDDSYTNKDAARKHKFTLFFFSSLEYIKKTV